MHALRDFLKRHALIIGIALMYLFTWPTLLSGAGVLHLRFPALMYVFMGWGFIAASVLMTGLTRGRAALAALLKRFTIWDVGIEWYAALLIIPATDLAGIALHAAFNGSPPDFRLTQIFAALGSWPAAAVAVLPVFLAGAVLNGEEIGWRGYALPRLQSRYQALYAALVVGLIWAAWHIPMMITIWNPVGLGWYILGVLAKSVFITWIYNSTRGSLLLATLCHAMWNAANSYLPLTATVSPGDMGTFAYVILVELAVAAVIIVAAGPEHLSRVGSRVVE